MAATARRADGRTRGPVFGLASIGIAVPVRAYTAVRILLALVLITAAVLKGHQLATEPVVGTSVPESCWFLIGLVELELLFVL